MNDNKNTSEKKVSGSVYCTKNYSLFKPLLGNRTVLENRKQLLISSIKQNGWITNPIIVNKNMEIIDGQHRYEALKELNMPIEYVICEDATIQDCIALNIKQQNWKLSDYIKCYAEMGNDDYVFLMEQLKKYHGKIPDSVIIHLAGNMRNDGVPSNIIKSGKYHAVDRESVDKRMAFIIDMFSIIGKKRGRTRLWGNVFKFVYYSDVIENTRMKDVLNKYIAEVTPAVTTDQAIMVLEKIYNRNRKGDKIYFLPEYEKYCKSA